MQRDLHANSYSCKYKAHEEKRACNKVAVSAALGITNAPARLRVHSIGFSRTSEFYRNKKEVTKCILFP